MTTFELSDAEQAAMIAFREHRSLNRVYDDGCIAERTRIVAWLREQGAAAMHTPNHYDLSQRSGPQHVLEWAADAIESGKL